MASAAGDSGGTSHHPHTSELATGGWGLSWCKERWWGPLIAVFAGTSPSLKLVSLSPTPSCVLLLTPSSTPSTTSSGPTQYAPLTCLAWAPNCGRNYHLLATGARDGTIRIWRVEPPGERGRVDYDTGGEVVKEWRGQCTGEFGKGGARIGTVDVRPLLSLPSHSKLTFGLAHSGTQQVQCYLQQTTKVSSEYTNVRSLIPGHDHN